MRANELVGGGKFARSYTLLLWVLGGLFALPLFSTLLVVSGGSGAEGRPLWVVGLTTGASLACFGVAASRAKSSVPARGLTRALSWALLPFVPVGTMAWGYWFFYVRHTERKEKETS
jgi:hypothetical protein